MSSANRARVKGRSKSKPFLRLPQDMLESDAYRRLSVYARALLIEIARQYRGNNNGDLTATYKSLASRGWRSKDTLNRSLNELKDLGFIVVTRRGGLTAGSTRIPTLYAISWAGIDECDGKHDLRPNPVPSNAWREKKSSPRQAGLPAPPRGSKGPEAPSADPGLDPPHGSNEKIPAPPGVHLLRSSHGQGIP